MTSRLLPDKFILKDFDYEKMLDKREVALSLGINKEIEGYIDTYMKKDIWTPQFKTPSISS